MKLYIGIDPGLSGGIAFIPTTGQPWAHKMPDNTTDLRDLLMDSICLAEPKAMLELVHSSPQMGVASSFTFGRGFGRLEQVLADLYIPFTVIRPQVWQKSLGCLTGGNKNVSKRRAQELFPNIKVTHAVADALLIAEFNRRTAAQ
jgi:crossover junction endodeoxyribonuclease RuvC